MNRTKIPWADYSLNPITGCTRVSEGCENCYAHTWAHRFRDGQFQITFHPERLKKFQAKKLSGKRVFVGSMTDMFHEGVKCEWRDQVFEKMISRADVTWMLLTKRPKEMFCVARNWLLEKHPHIWLGVTAENQKRADERIPLLLRVPAAVRFVSIEPMLEPICLTKRYFLDEASKANPCSPPTYDLCDWLTGFRGTVDHHSRGAGFCSPQNKLDWVIAGPETGAHKRPYEDWWLQHLEADCKASGVPFFDKRNHPGATREWPK